MRIEFNGSATRSLGVEIELGIVDDRTDELVSGAPRILADYLETLPEGQLPRVHTELFESTVEVVTGICRTPAEAHADLAATLQGLAPTLRGMNAGLIGSGVHPFARWQDLTVSDDDRYTRLVERIRWPVRRMMGHGVHFHVGVPTGEHAIAVTNALAGLLPHFLALSASSPYWLGADTGLASVRTKVFETMPSASLPPDLADWSDFERLANVLTKVGTIESVRDLWWDVRPSPRWGTVELRMCDGMATLTELCAVAGLAQAVVAYLSDAHDGREHLDREPDWVLRENKWRAARYGVSATLVHRDGRVSQLADEIRAWVERVRPFAQELGSVADLDRVLDILDHQPSYARQRDVVAGGGDLHDVVGLLRREFAQDRVGGQQ